MGHFVSRVTAKFRFEERSDWLGVYAPALPTAEGNPNMLYSNNGFHDRVLLKEEWKLSK